LASAGILGAKTASWPLERADAWNRTHYRGALIAQFIRRDGRAIAYPYSRARTISAPSHRRVATSQPKTTSAFHYWWVNWFSQSTLFGRARPHVVVFGAIQRAGYGCFNGRCG